jgi:hypothetical protein
MKIQTSQIADFGRGAVELNGLTDHRPSSRLDCHVVANSLSYGLLIGAFHCLPLQFRRLSLHPTCPLFYWPLRYCPCVYITYGYNARE